MKFRLVAAFRFRQCFFRGAGIALHWRGGYWSFDETAVMSPVNFGNAITVRDGQVS
jgi:hypothetical protein